MDTFHIIFSYWIRDLGDGFTCEVTFNIKFLLNHPDNTSEVFHERQYSKTVDYEFLNETINNERFTWTHPGIADYGEVPAPQ